jgi:prolyl-tRNA editing enzyme YbaK/EbsC (Cys-tRNA(Pro) deacylase)
MKKTFPTFFEQSALLHPQITVSAGVRGAQLLLDTQALIAFVGAKTADLLQDSENL